MRLPGLVDQSQSLRSRSERSEWRKMTEIPCQTVQRKRRGERDCEQQENESLHSLLHGHRDHVSPCPSVPQPPSLLPMHRELQDDKKPPIKTADLLTARDTRLNLQPFSRRRIDSLSEQRGGTLGDYLKPACKHMQCASTNVLCIGLESNDGRRSMIQLELP